MADITLHVVFAESAQLGDIEQMSNDALGLVQGAAGFLTGGVTDRVLGKKWLKQFVPKPGQTSRTQERAFKSDNIVDVQALALDHPLYPLGARSEIIAGDPRGIYHVTESEAQINALRNG